MNINHDTKQTKPQFKRSWSNPALWFPAGLFSAVMIWTDLPLHVHDDHGVGAVTHYKVLRVLGQQDDVVDCDVGAG